MDKLKKIKSLLADIGMPPAQQSDLCALTILAMANLKEIGSFASAIYVGWRVLHLFIYERGWTYVASVRYLSHYNVGCSVCASVGFVGVNV